MTTFAPCYPSTNSRYSYKAEDCFILFQPELSFAVHNLPSDTPQTNWEYPRTVRDKIRCAFRDAKKPYQIRETVRYPICHDIIRPLKSDDEIINWWKYKDMFLTNSE